MNAELQSRSPYLALWFAVLALSVPGLGCGTTTQTVRAYRAFAYEEPSLLVSIDRADDILKTLELVDRMMLRVPYAPGAPWVQQLALQPEQAARLRRDLASEEPYRRGGYEVPSLKLYRVHVEGVLSAPGPAPVTAPSEGRANPAAAPALFDVLALQGLLPSVRERWTEHGRALQGVSRAVTDYQETITRIQRQGGIPQGQPYPPELAAADQHVREARGAAAAATRALTADLEALPPATSAEQEQTMRDAAAVASVAYRMELEALALIPTVTLQAIRSIPRAGSELTSSAEASVRGALQVATFPAKISAAKEQMGTQVDILKTMAEVLARRTRTAVDDSAGFLVRDSLVDEVVGLGIDSFRLNVEAGAEVFAFSALGSQTKSSDDQGNSYDYTGRLRRADYTVEPIILARAKASLLFDYFRMPGAGELSFGYKTDRVFRSGGTLENGALAQQLGLTGAASDALEFGLGILGIRSSVRLATFDFGTFRYLNANTDASLASAPFKLKYTQVDVGYDVAFGLGEKASSAYIGELTVGARYFEYALPRVLYELEDQAPPGSQAKSFTYFNESAPQNVKSRYYLGGFSAQFGAGPQPWLSPFALIGVYGGAGPVAFAMRRSKAQECNVGATTPGCVSFNDPNDSTQRSTTALAVNGLLAAGLRMRLLRVGSRVRLVAELGYRGELIYSAVSDEESSGGKSHKIDFGGADLFHGGHITIQGSL